MIFATAVIGFGLQCLTRPDFVPGLQPMHEWIHGRTYCADATGVVFVTAGACMLARRATRVEAYCIASVFLLWFLLLHVPRLTSAPTNGRAWTAALEAGAIGASAWILASLRVDVGERAEGAANVAAMCYGVCLPGFGLLHFIYVDYVASVIPNWIPWPFFWAYFVGVAFCAAGLSIVTSLKSALAASLMAVMFGTWVLIVHLPRVAAQYDRPAEWGSLFVAMAMCGGAWLVAAARTNDIFPLAPSLFAIIWSVTDGAPAEQPGRDLEELVRCESMDARLLGSRRQERAFRVCRVRR